MFRKCLFLSFFLLFGVIFAAEKVVLIDHGASKAQVVIPDQPTGAESFAAAELVAILERVSNARLQIVRESAADSAAFKLWIGGTKQGNSLNINALPLGGFYLKSVDDGVIFSGRDNSLPLKQTKAVSGTLNAVYEFLERVAGVLWLYPDDNYGTVVRHKDKIEFLPLDVKWIPPFESTKLRRANIKWGRRAGRLAYHEPDYPPSVPHGHAFINWYKIYGKSRPDFFALVNGERRVMGPDSAMCVGNPDFQREIVRIWAEARTANPEQKFAINLCENDTPGICECPMCVADDGADKRFSFVEQTSKRFRNVGNRYAHFYKAVYDLASKIDPEVRVYGYAYSNYIYPPENVKLNPNIVIQFVPPASDAPMPYHPDLKHEVFKLLQGWMHSGCSLNYRPNILGGYAMPENYVRDYYEEFQLMRKCRMKEIDIDGPNMSFATQGPFLYVAARLCVHPDAKLDDLLDEYYSGFGPAKDAVREYWEYWESCAAHNATAFTEVPKKYNKERHRPMFGFHYTYYAHILFPAQSFIPAEKLLGKAAEAAKNSPDDLARVRFLQAGLKHAELCSAACAVFENPKSTRAQRIAAKNAVIEFRRNKLLKHAADVQLFTMSRRNESLTWIIDTTRSPNSFLELDTWLGMPDKENSGESKGYHLPDFDDSEWKKMRTDTFLERQGYSDYNTFWYRTAPFISRKLLNRDRVILHLGAVDESYVLYVNGKKVVYFLFNATNDPNSWQNPAEYDITDYLKPNHHNTIALQVINAAGNGGLWKPAELRFVPKNIAVKQPTKGAMKKAVKNPAKK